MISVLTTTYNRAEFLPNLLNSIYKSCVPVQHIIVDNLSTDKTEEIVNQYRDKYELLYIRTKCTQTQGLNIALSHAKFPWLGWINSDDYYTENGLELLSKSIQYDPIVSYGGMLAIFKEENNRVKYMPPHALDFVFTKLHTGNRLFQPTVLIKKLFLEKLGGWDTRFEMAQDYWLWAQAYMKNGRFVRIDKPIAKLIAHSGSLSVTKLASQREERQQVINILKKYVTRKGIRSTDGCTNMAFPE
jgi:hypothetical protein